MHDQDTVAPLAYTAEQAARALNIGRSSIYNLIAGGSLKATMIAGRRLIAVEELRALLRAQPSAEDIAAAEKRQRKAAAAVAVKRKRSSNKADVVLLDEEAA